MELFANGFETTVADGLTSSATTIYLSESLPAALTNTSGQFRLILQQTEIVGGVVQVIATEYVIVPGQSGSVLSGCTRGAEGSTALAWPAGSTALCGPTAGVAQEFAQLGSDNTVGGPGGSPLTPSVVTSSQRPAIAALTTPGYAQPGASVAMRPLAAAFANRNAVTPIIIAGPGDSITEGVGQLVIGARYLTKLQTALRALFPVQGIVGGDGYYPAQYNLGWTPPISWSGSPSGSGLYGLGLRGVVIGSSNTGTGIVTGSSVTISFSPGGAASATLSVQVDGGTAQTHTFPANQLSGKWNISTGLGVPIKAHALSITVTSGYGVFEGIDVYNGDETAGPPRVLDGSKSSQTVASYTGAWAECGPAYARNACCVIVELGVNDWRLNATSVATFQASLATLLSDLAAADATPRTYVLLVMPQPGAQPGSITWAQWVQAYYNVAAARTDTVVCDIGQRLYSYVLNGDSDPLGLFYSGDGLYMHLSNLGADWVAGILARFLAGDDYVAPAPLTLADEAYINLASNLFGSGWSNYGSGFAPLSYRKDSQNFVHLRGMVAGGGSGALIATLPAGYRPGYSARYPAQSSGGYGNYEVDANGTITWISGATSTSNYSLGEITFYAEN